MRGALRFGRYESLFRIAAGGMAEVFAARLRGEAGFQKLVAVKRILPALGEDATFTRMFLEEARVSAQLASPAIVQTLDMGRDEEGTPYLVQELVVGVDLLEVMVAAYEARARIPLPVALEIVAQAAIGLNDAHEARAPDGRRLELVHRDVSPHNLLVGADGRVRLTDFGIARVAFDRLVATRTGVLKGKMAYLAPEQASGGAGADRRTDIFGLGVVSWELLSGQRLFLRRTPTETLEAVREAIVPPLVEAAPDVPAGVAAVVHRALSVDPLERPGSARELATRVREAAREAGIDDASEVEVAAFIERLAPPRLVELQARMRQWAADPTVETLADIELPDGAPETTIDPGRATTPTSRADVEASTLIVPRGGQPSSAEGPTRRAKPAPVHEAETVMLGAGPPPTTVERPRRSALFPILMILLGLAMGAAAMWIALR